MRGQLHRKGGGGGVRRGGGGGGGEPRYFQASLTYVLLEIDQRSAVSLAIRSSLPYMQIWQPLSRSQRRAERRRARKPAAGFGVGNWGEAGGGKKVIWGGGGGGG